MRLTTSVCCWKLATYTYGRVRAAIANWKEVWWISENDQLSCDNKDGISILIPPVNLSLINWKLRQISCLISCTARRKTRAWKCVWLHTQMQQVVKTCLLAYSGTANSVVSSETTLLQANKVYSSYCNPHAHVCTLVVKRCVLLTKTSKVSWQGIKTSNSKHRSQTVKFYRDGLRCD